MQSLEPNMLMEGETLQDNKIIRFPEGLPAFEKVTEFVLIANEEEHPFLWLQAVSVPNLAFITIDPFMINTDYRPDICDEDVAHLELDSPEDAYVLSIVNINNEEEGDDGSITANLVGPIVINVKKKIGKQVILQNHLDYSVRFEIPTA